MKELIERLEKATGPDRELDALIWAATLPKNGNGIDGYGLPDGAHFEYVGQDNGRILMHVWHGHERMTPDCGRASRVSPSFTASIDAALTLMPPHHLWELKQGIQCRAVVWMIEVDYDDREPPIGRSTIFPAIALCIAALKAREALKDQAT